MDCGLQDSQCTNLMLTVVVAFVKLAWLLVCVPALHLSMYLCNHGCNTPYVETGSCDKNAHAETRRQQDDKTPSPQVQC
jgi:hypothetical protein